MFCRCKLLLISIAFVYLGGERHGGCPGGVRAFKSMSLVVVPSSMRESNHMYHGGRASIWHSKTPTQQLSGSFRACSDYLSRTSRKRGDSSFSSTTIAPRFPIASTCSRVLRSSIASTGTELDDEKEKVDPERYAKALRNTAIATVSALLFGVGINHFMGTDLALQYFAGYVVEQSLSVDNLFVFLLLFDFFKVPLEYQNRVLSWGIIGAVIMRGIFIALGEAAIESFQSVLLVFAAILLYSSFSLFVEGDEEEENLADNFIVKFATKYLDATEHYDGDRFFTLVDGVKKATPLLLVLACVELSDVVFAVDSIPAVFGVTTNPFIVYTSNIFAILNLRSLYTVLANAMGDLPYLKPSVAIVLGFVGGKLAAEYFGYDVSTALSLAFIATVLGGGVAASMISNDNEKKEEEEEEEESGGGSEGEQRQQ